MMQNQNKRQKGNLGEEYACRILSENGYSILCRNYTCKGGEIDIIAAKEEFLCFVEVKLRSKESGLTPSLSVDEKKLSRIRTSLCSFLTEYSENLHIISLKPRIDIFEIYTLDGCISKHNHIIGI